MTQQQVEIVDEYKWAWNLFKQDEHFNADELDYMQKIYAGILEESLKNLDQILMVVSSFKMQMSDAERLEIINQAADKMEATYSDLKQFNTRNIQLSIQRAKSLDEVVTLKEIYGIN